jgi:CheY-like chemotaxis protein
MTPTGVTILICDDERDLRQLMRLSLEPDYAFAEAATAREAIELAGKVRPDLVLLDTMLPGVNGLTVLSRLRADPELAKTPVVVVSAYATDEDRAAAFEAGATEFVKKPFDPERLRSLVESVLAGREPSQ